MLKKAETMRGAIRMRRAPRSAGEVGEQHMVERKPIKIVLLTHGGWGTPLLGGVEMIIGKVDFVQEIALLPAYTLPEYMGMVGEYVDGISPDSLIITDLVGGTPSNVAAAIGNQTGIKVYCGLNVPMLLEACVELQNDGRLDFDQILSAGQNACMDVVATVKANMAKNQRG
jgi:D-glucosaminate-specific PTS system IIA component